MTQDQVLMQGEQSGTDPDHPIGDPPEDSSGGQDTSDPRPVPGGGGQ